MKFFQQGDVVLVPVKSVPKEATEIHRDNAIQYGEITGHKHAFGGSPIIMFRKEDFEQGGNFTKFVIIDKPTMLTHEEHKPIEVPPGIYESRIVREFDHFSKLIRKVQD